MWRVFVRHRRAGEALALAALVAAVVVGYAAAIAITSVGDALEAIADRLGGR